MKGREPENSSQPALRTYGPKPSNLPDGKKECAYGGRKRGGVEIKEEGVDDAAS